MNSLLSPYIREGSGLKLLCRAAVGIEIALSPYIREGSGLKLDMRSNTSCEIDSPLTSVRGAD